MDMADDDFLEVNSENLISVVQGIRNLLWKNVLPKLIDLEQEVQTLRKVTWPYVQAQIEKENKVTMQGTNNLMFGYMTRYANVEEEIQELLKLKAIHGGRHISDADRELKRISDMMSDQSRHEMLDSSHHG